MITLLAITAMAADPTHAEILEGAGWKAEAKIDARDVGNVEVLRKDIGAIPCFQARAKAPVAQASLEEIVADVAGHRKWSTSGLTESKLLGRSDGGADYYQYLDVPNWTFASDRFWFIHGSMSHDANGAGIWRWKNLKNGGDYKDVYAQVVANHAGAVEPPVNVGVWWFKADGSGATDVRYYLCTDSGGALPSSLANAATRRTLPDTVTDLIREAKKRALNATAK